MPELVRDWVLDPIALLFMLSLLGCAIWIRQAYRNKALSTAIKKTSGATDTRAAGHPRRAVLLSTIWVAIFLFCSAPLIVNPLLTALEEQYPASQSCAAGSHVVVFGGGVDSRASKPDEIERMSESTLARATAAARLAFDEPEIRLIVSGGALLQISEADVIAAYWQKLGIHPDRIIQEDHASNTRENAVNVARILATESVSGVVRLVTSALHMPRALPSLQASLQGTGVILCPVSVDVQGLKGLPPYSLMPQTTSLVKFDKWLHEIVALFLYRSRGWM